MTEQTIELDQHRGMARLPLDAFDQVARQQAVRRLIGQGQGDSFDQAHGTSLKNVPADQMPGGSWPSASAISASS